MLAGNCVCLLNILVPTGIQNKHYIVEFEIPWSGDRAVPFERMNGVGLKLFENTHQRIYVCTLICGGESIYNEYGRHVDLKKLKCMQEI